MSVVDRDPADMVQVLDDQGVVRPDAVVPDIDDDELVSMYREMRLARHFDQRAVSLQRQGRMGTYPPLSGQEAAQIASVHALDDEDWLFPSYREHAAALVRGVSLEQTLLYWMGDERGNEIPSDVNVFPVAVPIATQVPHATGAAWAAKLRSDDRAFMVYFGDGATSEGDFHEGVNFAGVNDTPTVFFCNNNQWAISVPRDHQTASDTIAQKAQAYGIDGVQVDGMDPLAVYLVAKEAVDKAKHPGMDEHRPTLIEAVQYRFGAHTTADDPSVYRDEKEVEQWREKDPIPRMERFLRDYGLLDDERVDAIGTDVETTVADAIDAAESTQRPDPASIFEHVYHDIPTHLADQQAAFDELRATHGDDVFLRQ